MYVLNEHKKVGVLQYFYFCQQFFYKAYNNSNRGGASEASVATLTGDVDGSSRYIYVRQALGPITPRACAHGAIF